jgi:hypothetical protein
MPKLTSGILLLLLPIFSPFAHAELSVAEKIDCNHLLMTAKEEDSEIAASLYDAFNEREIKAGIRKEISKVRGEKKAVQKAMVGLYYRKLVKRIFETCVADGSCTQGDLARITLSETNRLFKSLGDGFLEFRGYALFSTLVSLGIVGSNKVFHGVDPIVASIVGGYIGGYIGMFKGVIDNKLNPLIETVKNKLWGHFKPKAEVTAGIKDVNKNWERTFEATQGVFNGKELGGRGDILGTCNDLFPKFTQLAHYQGREAALSIREQDDAARLLGSVLFQMRVFHPNLNIDNPHLMILLGSSARQYDTLFKTVEPKIWGALKSFELVEARSQGRLDFDRPAVNKYYRYLMDKWFVEPLARLEELPDLVSHPTGQ